MNGREQKTHKTAVTALQTQIDDLATLLEEIDTRGVEVSTRLQAVDDQHVRVSVALKTWIDALARSVGQLQTHPALTACTVWQRLRWIAVGR